MWIFNWLNCLKWEILRPKSILTHQEKTVKQNVLLDLGSCDT